MNAAQRSTESGMFYQLVIFDLGGVLVRSDSDRLVHQLAQLIGRSFDEVQEIVYHDELLLPLEIGQIKPEAYYDGLKRKLQVPWTYEQFVRSWNDILTEDPDVAWIVQRLRARHQLMALTNTNTLHIGYMKQAIPSLSLFHDVVASCDVGLRKPDAQIYRLVLERSGVRANRVVYIDDRLEMVEGGRSLGLVGIRFQSSRQLEHDLRQLGFNI